MSERMIEIQNHGPLILSTNYWSSEIEAAGKLLVSPNAGAIRVLLPRSQRPVINELRAAAYAVFSCGPWPAARLPDAAEILWEDHTAAPHAWQLSPESFLLLPGEPEPGREWTIAVWEWKKNRPHKALERVCHWRRVPEIPCLKPWATPNTNNRESKP